MFRPRTEGAARLLILLLICTASLVPGTSASVYAQQHPEAVAVFTARGISMYRKSDTLGAFEALLN